MTEFAVEVSRTIPGPRADVYRAFLDPDGHRWSINHFAAPRQ